MVDLSELFADVDAAFESLRMSGTDEAEQRRAGRAVLGALFEVRERLRLSGEPDYWSAVDASVQGRVAEGIMVIRGRMTHGALDDVRPAFKLAVPGPKLFPSSYTYPGRNLVWLELDEMPPDDRAELVRRDKGGRYADYVAGHLVLPTLDDARTFYRGYAEKSRP